MITKTRARNSDLSDFFGLDKLPKSSDIMKQKLIAMAKSGEPYPNHKTKEAKCLYNYTNKFSGSYCPNFDKTIRKSRPDWFESTSQIMRQKLIKMAKRGAKRPHCKTKEGQALCGYTCKFSSSYNKKFDKTIRKFGSDWFISTSEIMKQKLIKMAKNGVKRPSRKTKEGRSLCSYTNKSSSAYCPEFDKLIHKLRPDWFISTSEIMKQKLIKMAKSGLKRPYHKTKEAKCLVSYTNKSSSAYCPEFDKLIHKLRPDWFVSTAEIMKQKLIAMAKSGLKRPYHKTKEARALVDYTNKSRRSYCPKFDKTIRKLAPSWFIKKRTLAK
jgi:hypothetical protein